MTSLTTAPELRCDGAPVARRSLILAHGAGQPMRCEFMDRIARGLSAEGVQNLDQALAEILKLVRALDNEA